MPKYLDLDGLKYYKNKQDAFNDGKFVPQGISINGVALNKTAITITDDTKLSKTDAATIYLSKTDAAKRTLDSMPKLIRPVRLIPPPSWLQLVQSTASRLTARKISQSTQSTARRALPRRSSAQPMASRRLARTRKSLLSTSRAISARSLRATTVAANFTKSRHIRRRSRARQIRCTSILAVPTMMSIAGLARLTCSSMIPSALPIRLSAMATATQFRRRMSKSQRQRSQHE